MATVDINTIWNTVLPLLEKSLNRPIYEALISSTKPLSFGAGLFEVAVPNQVVKDWLSKYCVTLLEQELLPLLPGLTTVSFVVGPESLFSTPLIETVAAQPIKPGPALNQYLNYRYTFDAFVVGHGNRFAHAAAMAVAESPATAYNPFFLYGGVGLGKTHLMQSIGHRVMQKNPRAKILYTTSEMFTNELINSIRDDKAVQFRNKFRNIDILMVDDVQFIAGKERTQEEFFHTFNSLYEAHKQIVLSSDRPPKEMTTLEERLRSRFEWGLTADVQPPDFETRMAILKKKAEISGIVVSDDLLAVIASRIISNIRKLEGALIRVVAFSSLTNREINIALVDQVLKDISTPDREALNISIDLIKKITAEHFNLRIEDLSAKVRTEKIATARQVAMFLARELTGASLPKIGDEFGGRDHTTVLHACEKIKTKQKKDSSLADSVRSISTLVKKYTPSAV
ncbi:MAG: chromosomal replication initiator protein DnaA [Candidatus Margulisbacteria bacterium]|jgi:chromosomal replication initiator protein|nr:chromosomal replication initiator protein DnaA [Candidatus Margulisiibacteriota bacterium]